MSEKLVRTGIPLKESTREFLKREGKKENRNMSAQAKHYLEQIQLEKENEENGI